MSQGKMIPADVYKMLSVFVDTIQQKLPDFLSGLYLYGSIALGAYQPEKSDIDFVALLNRRCTKADFAILEQIHSDIKAQYPDLQLDGSYIQVDDVGINPELIAEHPYYDGTLHFSGKYDVNYVTWWVLQQRGITVFGDDLTIPDEQVNWQIIETAMHDNLNSYWHDWATNPNKFALLQHDGAIEWAILGILRLFYSFREKGIASKVDAGTYALKHLESQWHLLIRDALRIREGQASVYEDKTHRQREAQAFLQMIIAQSNQIVGK